MRDNWLSDQPGKLARSDIEVGLMSFKFMELVLYIQLITRNQNPSRD